MQRLLVGFVGGPRVMASRYKAVLDSIYPNKSIPKQIQQYIWYLVYCYKIMTKGLLSIRSSYWDFFNKVAIYTMGVLGAFPRLPFLPPGDKEWSFVYRLMLALNPHPAAPNLKIDTFGHYMIWGLKQFKAKINRFVSNSDPYKSMLLGLLSHKPREHEYAFQLLVLARRAPGGKARIKRSRIQLINKIIELNGIWSQYPFCHIHDWPNRDGRDSMLCGRCLKELEACCLVKSKFYPFVQHYLFKKMLECTEEGLTI